jgi:hypothetical protein
LFLEDVVAVLNHIDCGFVGIGGVECVHHLFFGLSVVLWVCANVVFSGILRILLLWHWFSGSVAFGWPVKHGLFLVLHLWELLIVDETRCAITVLYGDFHIHSLCYF